MIVIVSMVYKRIWRFDGVEMPFLTYLLFNLELLLGLLICSMVFVGSKWRRVVYDDILGRMLDILTIFQNLNLGFKLDLLGHLCIKLLIFTGILFVCIIVVDATHYMEFIKSAVGFGAYLIPHIVQITCSLQYVFVLTFAYQKFKTINNFLMSSQHVLRLNVNNNVGTLKALREQHMLLHQLAFKVNQHFGLFNIATVILVVTAISTTCLEVYQNIQLSDRGLYLVYSVLWVVLHGFKLILILYPNFLMENERNFTGALLHEYTPYTNTKNDIELKVFLRQIIHQKGPYTACGIIPLNLTIIANILGALATFLIILILFDQKP
ncbi:uncharacterized protein LOC129719823 [Wyeomyia smithii]|uniref:uncharacterized protein LOC129719823 n=1 Tax=Wyeomyia smithii TaxID=174621 RepID=UPI002467B770|nr:uncharacterized protein LOC129719823 [Wyeomyia smithii]